MTINYLYERLVDHRAEVESLEPPARAPQRTRCPVCGAAGPLDGWLSEHLRRQHPLLPPVLMVDGDPVGRTSVRRTPIQPGDVEVGNATVIDVSVDGGRSSRKGAGDLVSLLREVGPSRVDITLTNQRADGPSATRIFTLHLEIVDSSALDAVDAAFSSSVGDEPTISALDAFANAARPLEASRYAGALYDFLAALLSKDGLLPHAGQGLHYRDRLGRALDELRNHEHRALARAAAGVARLNLNAFPSPWPVCGIRRLDECATELVRCTGLLTTQSAVVGEAIAVGRCPVDRTTDAIVSNFSGVADPATARAAGTSLLRIASAPTTTPMDAAKARVLAMSQFAGDLDTERRQAALALVNDPQFGPFAIELLEQ